MACQGNMSVVIRVWGVSGRSLSLLACFLSALFTLCKSAVFYNHVSNYIFLLALGKDFL